jgi:hypothetical protein
MYFPANQLGRIERSDGNFAFTYTTDEHGFRNRSPWPERADIVVLGDSMAFGYGVEDDQAWPTLLEENLPDSRVINLGLIGAAPQQYFRIYKTFGQALQPSLVLFCLFPGNDVTDAGLFNRWVKAGSQGNYLIRDRPPAEEHRDPRRLPPHRAPGLELRDRDLRPLCARALHPNAGYLREGFHRSTNLSQKSPSDPRPRAYSPRHRPRRCRPQRVCARAGANARSAPARSSRAGSCA